MQDRVNRWRASAAMVATALTLIACGGPASTGNTIQPYLVAVSVAQTGPVAIIGGPEAQAVQLVIDDANKKGGVNGHQIKLDMRDNGGQIQQTVVLAKTLLAEHPQVFMAGSVVAQMKAVEPLVENGPLTIDFGSGYRPPIPSYIFSPSPYDNTAIDASFDFFRSKGLQRFAMLATTDATGQLAVEEIGNELKGPHGAGLTLVAQERFDPAAPDVTPQLTRIKAQEPQAILGWATGAPAGVVAKDFTQLGLTMPLILSWGNGSLAFAKQSASFAPKNVYVPVSKAIVYEQLPASDPMRATGEQLSKQWEAAYHTPLDLGSVLGLDPAMAIIEVLKTPGAPDSKKMLQALEGGKIKFSGVWGPYHFSSSDHKGAGTSGLVLARVENGKFVVG